MKRWLALLALVAGTARADVWESAIGRGNPDPNRENYDHQMKAGDELALQAASRSTSPTMTKRLIKQAADAYKAAAAAEPSEGEPYYRLGYMLWSFYFHCSWINQFPRGGSVLCHADPSQFDRQHAEETIAAWDAFEQRAPMDPRLSVVEDPFNSENFVLLFERAILNTKLATKEHLEAATRDYRALLARLDTSSSGMGDNTLSNLAETAMMLGNLDEAIDTYREALSIGANSDTAYGLAVALDRDDRGAEAADLVLRQGPEAYELFRQKVLIKHVTFFVPQGEQDYYFALINESYGYDDDALREWRTYIQSGAHPEFQPRAKQHIEALLAKRKLHPDDPMRHAPDMRLLP